MNTITEMKNGTFLKFYRKGIKKFISPILSSSKNLIGGCQSCYFIRAVLA